MPIATLTHLQMFRYLAVLLSLYSPRPDFQSSIQYWARELGLQDWHITVKVVSRDMLEDGTAGSIEAYRRHHVAVIRVLRESDSDLPKRQARADQRLTIAHEMVHLSRLVRDGDRTWRDEPETVRETYALLQKHRRWRELSVAEP